MQVGKLEYDGNLSIAIGMSVSSKIWKNTKITWSALVQKLSTPVVTAETYKQFMNATKDVFEYVAPDILEISIDIAKKVIKKEVLNQK